MKAKKRLCKNQIKELLKDLDYTREDASLEDIQIESIPNLPLFNSANSFGHYLESNYGFKFATARNAVRELLKDGIIYICDDGYYSLSSNKHSSITTNNISSHIYATILPVENASYIEVPNNMAYVLSDELNTYLYRNDKRFYAISHNLLLLLDLKIPSDVNIVEKDFDIYQFLQKHGIPIKDYNLSQKNIRGYDENSFLGKQAEVDLQHHISESPEKFEGHLNSPRRISPRIKSDND